MQQQQPQKRSSRNSTLLSIRSALSTRRCSSASKRFSGMKTLLTSLLVGLLSSSAAFAIDDGKLNLICTVRHSLKIPMLKSPSSRTINGSVENNAVVTLLDEMGSEWAHIRKDVGTT